MLLLLVGCGRIAFEEVPDARDDGIMPDVNIVGTRCMTLPDRCGPARSESCCATSTVPAGTFFRGYDVGGDAMFPSMTAPATISELALEKYEVTVGRFRAFVDAGQGTQASPPAPGSGARTKIPNSGWDASWDTMLAPDSAALRAALACDPIFSTWTDQPAAGGDERPINCITFYEAFAFCAWDGGFLPTEAESNYAASGGDEHRPYPSSSPPNMVSIDETLVSFGCLADFISGCLASDLEIVGSKPAGNGRWGHADIAGSVWERVLDYFAAIYPVPCNDCSVVADVGDPRRMIRGGSFFDPIERVRSAYRNPDPPDGRTPYVGVRCARLP